MPRKKENLAIVLSGNINIGFKFIGPLTIENGMDFCKEIKNSQDPEISHADLLIVPLYSPLEALREVNNRGHLMSSRWLCLPRR